MILEPQTGDSVPMPPLGCESIPHEIEEPRLRRVLPPDLVVSPLTMAELMMLWEDQDD